jgi:hypothetical protein
LTVVWCFFLLVVWSGVWCVMTARHVDKPNDRREASRGATRDTRVNLAAKNSQPWW